MPKDDLSFLNEKVHIVTNDKWKEINVECALLVDIYDMLLTLATK